MKRNSEQILDEWLVSSAQAGDQQAFISLVKRWRPKLLAYASSQLQDSESAKDVVQDVLLKVSQSLIRLDDPIAFPKWVYQILHRRCVDLIRHKQVRRKYESSEEYRSAEAVEKRDHLLENTVLNKAIRDLEPQFSQVVRLFYVEGFSTREMAEILSLREGTVKSRLFTARNKLKTLLEEESDG